MVFLFGGRSLTLDEPLSTVSYVSVFIPHFIGNPAENHEILRKLYLEFDLSSYQISDLTGWSRTAISDYLRKAEINKEFIKSPIPRYGEREVGGVRVPHQAEQKVIQKIVTLKSKGHSFREIAKFLTESGVLSKRGGQWSKTTIQEIFKREQEKKK
ncbi:MAG: hypothetical protein CME71_02170 [Halobacteriovorax sp.]|nr:hypothetical protein [Halobacteriovorax sp.]